MALIRVLTAALLMVAALATGARARTDSSPLPGMPPVLDPHDIYAAARPGALSATVRGDVYRVYVPNSHSSSVDVIDPATFGSISVPGFTLSAFKWKHRDINLTKAMTKAVFHGNATQLSWAWSSATRAPFYAPYTGFHVGLPDGLTILNYNEGFNTKMTDAEIGDLGRRYRTDVLLAGMQLNFIEDVVRGVAALRPKVVILYPPHDRFHAMMGAVSEPWPAFAAALTTRFPEIAVHIAEPGFELAVSPDDRSLLTQRVA